MARIGVGIVGLGMALKPHMLALRDLHDRVDLIGGFSPTAARRSDFAKAWDLSTVDSLDALLDDKRISAVLISTPPRTHAELALRAARAGKHVLVEKPLDIDHASARRLVDRSGSARTHVRRRLSAPFPSWRDRTSRASARSGAGRSRVGIGIDSLVAVVRVFRRAWPRHDGP